MNEAAKVGPWGPMTSQEGKRSALIHPSLEDSAPNRHEIQPTPKGASLVADPLGVKLPRSWPAEH